LEEFPEFADLDPAAQILRESRRVVLGGHPHMDGDALGSVLALRAALAGAGRECLVVTQDLDAGKYAFLEGADKLVPLDNLPDLKDFDTCVMLDCGAYSRARAVIERLGPGTRVVNLDHHIDNPGYGDAAVVLPRASSTGEVVFKVLQKAEIPLTKGAAEALFVAIMTDTGRFMFSNSTPDAFRIMADIIEGHGLDVAGLTRHIYRSKSPQRLQLEGMVAASLEPWLEGKLVVARVTQAMLAETGCSEAEANEMIAIPKSAQGAMVCILFRESGPEDLKVSWRSEGQIAVNDIAATFRGGGHQRAAGANIRGRAIAEAEQEVIEATVKVLAETLERTGGAIIV
jgi:bifunctional oligoribonuclease and PAP phosphatase NrnA